MVDPSFETFDTAMKTTDPSFSWFYRVTGTLRILETCILALYSFARKLTLVHRKSGKKYCGQKTEINKEKSSFVYCFV